MEIRKRGWSSYPESLGSLRPMDEPRAFDGDAGLARRFTYRLKTRWRDGTTHILMERHELLERLAPLIPPPRAHQVRYRGILAPCTSGRDHVAPSGTHSVAATSAGEDGDRRATCSTRSTRTHRPREAETEASTNAGLQQQVPTTHEVSIP